MICKYCEKPIYISKPESFGTTPIRNEQGEIVDNKHWHFACNPEMKEENKVIVDKTTHTDSI